MPSHTAQYSIGGAMLAAAGWVLRHLTFRWREEREEKVSGSILTVREWMESDLHDVLSTIKAGIARLDVLLVEADLPGMRKTVSGHTADLAVHEARIRSALSDISDLRREKEELEDRVDRLERRKPR